MPVNRSENIATYESNREFERRMKRRERQKAKVTPKEQAERYHDAHLAHEEREQPAAVAKRQKAVVRRASAEKSGGPSDSDALEQLAHSPDRGADVVLRVGVGDPHVALAVLAEGRAGEHRDAGLLEQLVL